MKICVLQPDYSTTSVDYKDYDPPRNLSKLMPEAEMDHVFINKLSTYKQLKALGKKGYDIFVNLCEGYPDWEVPGYDVYFNAEMLNLPITGPGTRLFDVPKKLMKYVAYCEGVRIPAYALINSLEEIEKATAQLNYPLFVKPAHAGDSLGVDEKSLVHSMKELKTKCASIIEEYGPLLVEEYIAGREFTVLVAADPNNEKDCVAFRPVEYIFPEGREFKTYALKTSELHPDCNFPCNDPVIDKQLREAAKRIFLGFGGVGYARMDFRMNTKNEIYFLELNFTCSVFYTDGYEGSADFILKFDGIGQDGFLRHIIAEGINRHKRKQKLYEVRGNAISGFGMYTVRNISSGELIFNGEEKPQRLVTLRQMQQTWSEEEKEHFRRYAYPISKEVFIIWDADPTEWAPQNHSCDANCAYDGLNVVALRDIDKGEELTLDYAHFLDKNMEPFHCNCGSPNCRGLIMGLPNNSLTHRETKIRIPKNARKKTKAG
ncbi:MAG: SET domain-containing protein-lysine N-methyltransferase [Chitinophagaceae bacterium]|nr:MAG: SET domain-containing protein-lysine N-methyltransferase [Chitinophagaceae bacterium]